MTRDRLAAPLAALATLLTTWSLAPTVDGSDWQTPTVLVVTLVLLTGVGARALRTPRALVPLAQLVVGVLALTAAFARDAAVWWVLPGPAALDQLAHVVVDGFDTINRYAAPVPTSDGISLILASGVLVVAVAVDAAVVGWRSPAAAGLPLLALYAVPAAVVPDGLPWRYFVAAAVGWLLLLAHDASGRVLRWGRLLPRWGGSASASRQTLTTDTAAMAATGRRLGVAAIVLAVVLPALVPGLPESLLTRGGSGSGPGGIGGLTVINPVLTLRDNLTPRQDIEILRYNTSQADVQPLRIVTADTFDGDTWKPGTRDVSRRNRASRGLPTPPGLSPEVSQSEYSMRIKVSDALNQDFLPLPYPTRTVDIKGAWLYDAATLNVIGDGETVRGRSYDLTYLAVRPTAEQLRDAPPAPAGSMDAYTALPRDLPSVVARTARAVTKGAATQYDQAMALQQWFRSDGNFVYSTDAPADSGGSAVADFLSQRKGFCVQFSSAMAVMARSLGIPARIAVGFLPGTPVQDNWWSVRLTDAHAWPELYFQNVGWVRFEPTPAARTGAPPQWAQVGAAAGGPQVGSTVPTAGGSGATATDGPGARIRSLQDAERRVATGPVPEPVVAPPAAGRGLSTWWRVVALVVLLLAALALTPVTALLGRRRRRRAAVTPTARAEAAWADLHELVADLGIALPASLTPRQVDRRLQEQVGLAEQPRAALARVTSAVERARYARPADGATAQPGTGTRGGTALADVDHDVQVVVRAVAGTRRRGERWRAALYPSSGAARTARVAGWLGQRLASADSALARWSHRVRLPRVHRRP